MWEFYLLTFQVVVFLGLIMDLNICSEMWYLLIYFQVRISLSLRLPVALEDTKPEVENVLQFFGYYSFLPHQNHKLYVVSAVSAFTGHIVIGNAVKLCTKFKMSLINEKGDLPHWLRE